MAELREYNVVVNGNPTTMQLTEEDAKRLDAEPVDKTFVEKAKAIVEPPKNKARNLKGR